MDPHSEVAQLDSVLSPWTWPAVVDMRSHQSESLIRGFTSSSDRSLGPIGTSAPVLDITSTLRTEGKGLMAESTMCFSSWTRPPRTPWSAVITTSALPGEGKVRWQLQQSSHDSHLVAMFAIPKRAKL